MGYDYRSSKTDASWGNGINRHVGWGKGSVIVSDACKSDSENCPVYLHSTTAYWWVIVSLNSWYICERR